MRRHSLRSVCCSSVSWGLTALTIFLGAVACSEPADEASQEPQDRIELRPDLVLGVVEGREEESFGRVTGLLGDEAGRIYVLDGQASTVRVFDSIGKHLFSFGRWGEGPGELSGACCLGWDPDGLLWVREGGNARYSAFRIGGTDTEFIRTIHHRHSAVNLWAETTFSRTGHLIDVGARTVGSPPSIERVRFFLEGSGIDSVEVIESPPPEMLGEITVDRELPSGASARLFFFPPFGSRHSLANGPGGVWAEAISSDYAVVIQDGESRTEIRHPAVAGPELSTAEKAFAEEQIAGDVRRSGRSSLPLDVPNRKPPLRGLYFDSVGRLWVELSVAEDSPHWAEIYESNGALVAEATWPGNLDLGFPAWPGNGEWSLALQTDSLGVQRVVRMVHASGNRLD